MTTPDDQRVTGRPSLLPPSPVPPSPVPPGPGPTAAVPSSAPEAGDEDLFEEDGAYLRPRRTNGWTKLLITALVGVIGFGGGVLAQKSHDAGLVSSAGSPGAFRSRPAAGQGGFGGNAGEPGGFGNNSPGAARPGPAGGAAGGDGETDREAVPSVVGTVTAVSASRITVTNFAGTPVPVLITPATTVTLIGTTSLTTGLSAAVVGTKSSDGSVTAGAITIRTPG